MCWVTEYKLTGTTKISSASVLATEYFPFTDWSFLIHFLFCLFRDVTLENAQRWWYAINMNPEYWAKGNCQGKIKEFGRGGGGPAVSVCSFYANSILTQRNVTWSVHTSLAYRNSLSQRSQKQQTNKAVALIFIVRLQNCVERQSVSSCLFVCLSVNMEQLCFRWPDLHEMWYLYESNSISNLQIQVATYVFELSAGNCHR
jgi:hypothetical protein